MNPILHSLILGEGKPMLILHGFLGMLDNWKTLGNKYAEAGYQVHLIDQRNHGDSFWSTEFNYEAMSADLLAYMEHHKLDKILLIGHSMGGKTAMQFACEYPGRVDQLLVADIGPKYYPPHHDNILDALNSLEPDQLGSRSDADRALAEKIPDFGTRQFLLKNLYWKEKGKLAFRCNLEVLTEASAEVGEPLSASSVYPGPTLFIKGGNSEYITASDLAGIRRHFPDSSLETIPKAGHWLHAESPDLFFEISIKFMNSSI